jgi:hypothetical protein
MGKQNKCVHTEHCCVKHGCKYGDDNCPVWLGYKRQSFPCELCSEELAPYYGFSETYIEPTIPKKPSLEVLQERADAMVQHKEDIQKLRLTTEEKAQRDLWFAYVLNELKNAGMLNKEAIVKLVHSCNGHQPRPITVKDVERTLEHAYNVVLENDLA